MISEPAVNQGFETNLFWKIQNWQ